MEHYSFLAGSSTSLLVDFCSCTFFLWVARLHIAVNLLPQPGTGHAIFAPPCRARLMCGEISWNQYMSEITLFMLRAHTLTCVVPKELAGRSPFHSLCTWRGEFSCEQPSCEPSSCPCCWILFHIQPPRRWPAQAGLLPTTCATSGLDWINWHKSSRFAVV